MERVKNKEAKENLYILYFDNVSDIYANIDTNNIILT